MFLSFLFSFGNFFQGVACLCSRLRNFQDEFDQVRRLSIWLLYSLYHQYVADYIPLLYSNNHQVAFCESIVGWLVDCNVKTIIDLSSFIIAPCVIFQLMFYFVFLSSASVALCWCIFFSFLKPQGMVFCLQQQENTLKQVSCCTNNRSKS